MDDTIPTSSSPRRSLGEGGPATSNPSNLSPLSQPRAEPSGNLPTLPSQPLESHKKKLFYLCLLAVLIMSVSLLSIFFISNSRQPKTNSRAAIPSPTLSLSNLSHLSNLSPTLAKSSGFGSLIVSSPTSQTSQISPISTSPTGQEATPTSPARSSLGEGGPTAPTSPSIQTIQTTPASPTGGPPTQIVFDITAANNSFLPNQLEAYVNQIIVFNVFATDKDYDLNIAEFGVKKVFKQGVRSSMEFQATSTGLYTFTCSENCSSAGTAKGLLTVKP